MIRATAVSRLAIVFSYPFLSFVRAWPARTWLAYLLVGVSALPSHPALKSRRRDLSPWVRSTIPLSRIGWMNGLSNTWVKRHFHLCASGRSASSWCPFCLQRAPHGHLPSTFAEATADRSPLLPPAQQPDDSNAPHWRGTPPVRPIPSLDSLPGSVKTLFILPIRSRRKCDEVSQSRVLYGDEDCSQSCNDISG